MKALRAGICCLLLSAFLGSCVIIPHGRYYDRRHYRHHYNRGHHHPW